MINNPADCVIDPLHECDTPCEVNECDTPVCVDEYDRVCDRMCEPIVTRSDKVCEPLN